MKIALLFSGQYRDTPDSIFLKGIDELTNQIDYDIYSYCWNECGVSKNHKKIIPQVKLDLNAEEKINKLFKNHNLKLSKSELFEKFQDSLDKEYLQIMNSSKFSHISINSIPQIYMIYKSYKMITNDINKYDLVFRCRYDSIFLHPLNIYPLKKISSSNCIYNINFGRAYYPKRIYDIFFGGSPQAMGFIEFLWNNLPDLINNKLNNGLDNRDSCRLLYIGSLNASIQTKSLKTRICDVYRNNNPQLYIKYIISSHISKYILSIYTLKMLKSIWKWNKYLSLSSTILFINLFKMLAIYPIMIIKRFKYLYINHNIYNKNDVK